MDVYHKVLTRIFQDTDGKETVDVDLAELLKKEGFFPSIENIRSYLSSESWIAETNKTNIIRITHWGVAEAKRALSNAPDSKKQLEKESTRLMSATKELLVMAEEFAAAPSKDRIKNIERQLGDVTTVVDRIRSNL